MHDDLNFSGASTSVTDVRAPSRGLAAAFREPLTAIARLGAGRGTLTDAPAVRNHLRQSLASSAERARVDGHPDEFVEWAVYAIVALLDEVMLRATGPLRDGWAGNPLQQEIFGHHTAGERFFSVVNDLLQRQDSPFVADVLEVYLLCLYLGFEGRYSVADRRELKGFSSAIEQKIRRIRGRRAPMMVHAVPPPSPQARSEGDPTARLMAGAVGVGGLCVIVLLLALRFFVLLPGARTIAGGA